MICINKETIHRLSEKIMKIECGCHCINCKSTNLESTKVGIEEKDGYFNMHHTCQQCNAHFDHLDGEIFPDCLKCDYSSN